MRTYFSIRLNHKYYNKLKNEIVIELYLNFWENF